MSGLKRLVPLFDRVLVKRILPATKSAGGIILPEANVGKPNEGEVLAVGPGFEGKDGVKISVSVKVGDRVLLPEYGGTPVKLDGEEGVLFSNSEILAKFT